MSKFLDRTGLSYLISKIKDGSLIAGKANKDANGNVISNTYATKSELSTTNIDILNHTTNQSNPHNVTMSQLGFENVENKSSATIRSEITSDNITNALGYTPIDSNLKGVANGMAELDDAGKVPASQLPSFVDDVLEYNNKSSFPTIGESGKIYVDLSTNMTYRWSGSSYVVIGNDLALGETSSTAYAGNKGKANADNIANIISGTTKVGAASSADSAVKAVQDEDGNIIADTYVKKSSEIAATLSATSWVGSSAPFIYNLTVNGVTATSAQELLPSTSITPEQLDILQGAAIIDGGQSTNTIVLKAFGEKPTIDIPIRIIKRNDL